MDSNGQEPPRYPRRYTMDGLPGSDETKGTLYEFYIGGLHYVPPYDSKNLYLHITEMTHRDAEGRPRFPEQEAWIRRVLAERKIDAEGIWWSHWRFATPEDAASFERVLLENGASRV